MNPRNGFYTPQLELLHQGKVRDSYRVDEASRLIVTTDRLSAFDRVLDTAIPGKGAILNRLAAFWFDKVSDILPHHMIRPVSDCAMLVREAEPIRLEMIVRGYLAGSSWRAYQGGRREVSGVKLPDGLTRNAKFPEPIVTPTTKEKHDREIRPEDAVREGLVSAEGYRVMEEASRRLFAMASDYLAERGMILVDTKYEFGWIDGQIVLIDEAHTPDSSRYWSAEDYARDPESIEAWDKEYVRGWLLEQTDPASVSELPEEVVAETVRRYAEIYERITGEPAPDGSADLTRDLVDAGLMKDAFVAIVMGSAQDEAHARTMADELASYGVYTELRVASAHKTPHLVEAVTQEYNAAVEPGAVIAVAGLSNGLGGALAANLAIPVFSCPPFADRADRIENINSSLMMPSKTPAATIVRPGNAAQAALRSLNLPRLKARFLDEIAATQALLADDDRRLRGESG